MDITVTAMEGTLNNSQHRAGNVSAKAILTSEKFDAVIEVILVGLLAFMPFAFGAIHAWSGQVVVAGAGCMVLCLLARQVMFPSIRFFVTPAYLTVLLFLAVAAIAIIPFPAKLVSVISPETVALKSELLFGDSAAVEQGWKTTLSFYVNNTKAGLRLAVAAAGIFFVVVNVFNDAKKIKRLLKAIVCVGAAVAVLAVLQDVFGNGKLYWLIKTPLKTHSGPFINHSHFAQFMNLSIGAALGLLFVKLTEDFANENTSVADVFEYFDSAKARGLWMLVAMMSVSAVVIFMSLSRGGMISMLFAGSFTVLIAAMRKNFRRHGWIVVVIALAALLCILYTSFDTVYDRFASLGQFDDYQTRIDVVKDMLEPIRKFVIFGTGLGSHEVVYPMFQNVSTGLEFAYAENEYAQLFEEMGLAGFVAMLGFGSFVCVCFVRALRMKEQSLSTVVYGLGFGLAAILIHSFSDFGQHLPANTVLTVVFCGLIIVIGQKKKMTNAGGGNVLYARIFRVALLVVAAVIFGWALTGARLAASAEGNWREAEAIREKIRVEGINIDKSEFRALLGFAGTAVEKQPGNVKYRQWFNTYRWWNVSRGADGVSGIDYEEVGRITEDLKNATLAAPSYGPIYCLLGQLQKFVLLEPVGEDNIEKGYRLESNDELTLFAAGYVDLLNARVDESMAKFKKSVEFGGIFFKEMVQIYIGRPEGGRLVIELASKDIARLKYVIGLLESYESLAEAAEAAKERLIAVMEERVVLAKAGAQELADLGSHYGNAGNYEKAIGYYKMALVKNYEYVSWRLQLAKVLADSGDVENAMRQCRICLRLSPGHKKATEMLGQLVLRPEAIGK